VGLFYKDAMASGAGAVYDFGSDSILRDVTSGVRYAYTCPSVVRSGDGFAWVQSAAVGADYELVKMDADSGDPVVVGTLVDSGDSNRYLDGIPDAFGWGIINVQGDRL